MFEQIWHDIRYASRQLWRAPLFTLVSTVSLAVAITIAVAAYSLVNSLIFKPLPVRDPDGVMHIFGIRGDRDNEPSGYSNLKDYAATGLFSSVAASAPLANPVVIVNNRAPERIETEYVSPNFFQTIGVELKEGRRFATSGDAQEVIISERYRNRAFPKGARVLGSVIRLNGMPFTVVGVTPHTYRGFLFYSNTALWIPAPQLPYITNGRGHFLEHEKYWNINARLMPGITARTATARLAALPGKLAALDPGWRDGGRPLGIRVISYPDVVHEATRDFLGGMLLALSALVAIILLLACTNVAGLLLARAVSRRHEVAVRLTLGASRRRIASQFMTEALMLSLLGGALGFLGAQWIVMLTARSPLFDRFDLSADWRVFGITLLTCVLCAIAFGSTPLAHTLRININSNLAGTGLIGERGNVRGRLIALQVCLSFMLVVLGMHASRGVQAKTRADAAFNVDGLLVAEMETRSGSTPTDSIAGAQYVATATTLLRSMPTVLNTSVSSSIPAGGADGVDATATPMNAAPQHVRVHVVDADYFATLGVHLTSGQIPRADQLPSRPGERRIAVVSRLVREKLGSSLIGRTIRISNTHDLYIVGEVPELGEVDRSQRIGHIYEITNQGRSAYRTNIIARLQPGSEAAVIAAFTSAMRDRFASRIPPDVTTLRSRVDASLAPQRYVAGAASAFGFAELVLAAIGLYSMLLYATLTRTREIGIRMALGAVPGRASYAVLKSGLIYVLAGLVLGGLCSIPAGIIAGRTFEGSVARDPVPYLAAAFGIIIATAAAAFGPARKAATVEPMVALRYQ